MYRFILAAELSAKRALDLAHAVGAPLLTRLALGRAQSILMRYVRKHAGALRDEETLAVVDKVREIVHD
jgi:hypothetical protein